MPSLGNDLALIRKHRGLSLEDVRNATKIPPHILSSIEDDSLFSEMEEHKTYLRSYVRSYAKALKIDENTIVEALDRQEEGRYKGMLRKEEESLKGPRFQLDEEGGVKDPEAGEEEVESAPGSPEESEEEEKPGSGAGKGGVAAAGDTPLEEDSKASPNKRGDMVHDHAPDSGRETSGAGGTAGSETRAKAGSPKRVPSPPDVTSVDWANMGKKFTPLQSRPRLWIAAVIAVLLLAAAAAWFVYGAGGNDDTGGQNGGEETAAEQQAAALTPDSLQLDLSQEPAGAAGEPVEGSLGSLDQEAESLPDTLVLAVYAAYGRLEPVRVYSDVMNATNPYWIEQGEAFTFEFVDQIHIRGQFSQMELLMNGHPVPDFRNTFFSSESGMLEIGRSWFEQDPRWLQPPPDSLQMEAPPPDTIRERPTFN